MENSLFYFAQSEFIMLSIRASRFKPIIIHSIVMNKTRMKAEKWLKNTMKNKMKNKSERQTSADDDEEATRRWIKKKTKRFPTINSFSDYNFQIALFPVNK